MEGAAGEVATAGVAVSPQRISNQAARFLREHLRMEHLRQYVLDVFKTYAALQTFQVGTQCRDIIHIYDAQNTNFSRFADEIVL